MRILIVDDSMFIPNSFRPLLEKAGHEVESASNGEVALERIAENPPDLVISDVVMPVMDGFTLLQKIRAQPELKSTPVIFLSAIDSVEKVKEAFKYGADDYLAKPVDADHFMERVTQALLRRRRP